MINALRERWLAPRTPTGYRPGVTLGHLLRNLGPLQVHGLEASAAVVHDPVRGWHCELRECVQAHLLMHLVSCELKMTVPALQACDMRLDLRHTGALRRTGVTAVYRGGDKARFAQVRDRLMGHAALLAALMPLDFKRLTLACRDGQWQLVLEHMGGSEVVNRMPAFRRYIQVSPPQRAHLLACLGCFNEALRAL
ncbi:DUF3156 family protein [Pseudomonas sp. RP23018S]|uniref:DUF3156 family protein n=1 Tax=Pseudomonas sp. RP23018S TaxID=3096037 RepID=UPI002ACA9D5F|nr:DUF3156 family protein [Pseudomonas sp. RP23018S]MDZ5602858.1 DUF3156 family protein [Pseudomonas sp. RP23018S]